MKASEGKLGRAFIIRLEDGDVVPDCLEQFAAEKGIKTAQVVLVGGLSAGEVVVGPRRTEQIPPDPLHHPVTEAHEVVAVGIIAPDRDGRPVLHIHGSLGREGKAVTGCLRPGVKTWLVAEAIITEITGASAARLPDKASGFNLLEV